MYLEPLFMGSQEVQKELPVDCKRFQKQDKVRCQAPLFYDCGSHALIDLIVSCSAAMVDHQRYHQDLCRNENCGKVRG